MTQPSDQPATRSLGQRVVSLLTEALIILVGAVLISTLLRSFVAQMFVIPSGSMENTLQVDDRVLVSKFGGFQRGDVVVFSDPGGWLPHSTSDIPAWQEVLEFFGVLPSSSTEHLIKRIIGMPGDHVVCCSPAGKLVINDVEVDESAYLYSEAGVQVAPATIAFDVVVPAEHIFVLGDHRNQSADSRCRLTNISDQGPPGSMAFIPYDHVVGASVAIVAPLSRAATFHVPEALSSIGSADSAPAQAVITEASPGC